MSLSHGLLGLSGLEMREEKILLIPRIRVTKTKNEFEEMRV